MDLWDQIEKPSIPGTLKVRRADPGHPHNFFRGRDHRGCYLLQLRGEFELDASLVLPNIAGISVAVEQIGNHESQLSLLLNENSQNDIFRALCADLMVATAKIPAGQERLTALGSFRFSRLLRKALAATQEPAGLPRIWRFVDALPVSDMGKRREQDLQDFFTEGNSP